MSYGCTNIDFMVQRGEIWNKSMVHVSISYSLAFSGWVSKYNGWLNSSVSNFFQSPGIWSATQNGFLETPINSPKPFLNGAAKLRV